MFGAELGVKNGCSLHGVGQCAFRLVSAGIVHEYSLTRVLPVPAPPEEINAIYAPMIAQARQQLKEEGFHGDKVKLERSIDLRYCAKCTK
jgi:N-methylhydantoinase A